MDSGATSRTVEKFDLRQTVGWKSAEKPRALFEQAKMVLGPADKSPRMSEASVRDHYEVLQISPNAELDTANRVYRGRNVSW